MFKNPNYIYGPTEVLVPPALQFGEFCLKRMWECKEKTALINAATDESITYGEISQQAMNLAVSLVHLGLRKGQTVAVCSENRLEFFGVVVGIANAGGVVTTINPGYVEAELVHVMKISKPKFIVCSPYTYKKHGKLFNSLPHVNKIIVMGKDRLPGTILLTDLTIPVRNDIGENIVYNKNDSGDIIVNNKLTRNVRYEEFEAVDVKGQVDTLFILYSSGTTGLPKGVMLSHLNLLTMCNSPTSNLELKYLVITPWFHTMGLMGSLAGLCYQRTSIFLPRFEVDLYLRTVEKYKIAMLSVVPPVLVAVLKAPKKYDLSSVQFVYSGAAPLHKDTADLINTTFPNAHMVLQGYGMTETTLAVMRGLPGIEKPGSVGKVTPGMIVKVVDTETRKPLGPNQPGEICIKGPIIMQGYVGKDPKETFDSEGFFPSGDVGYYDDDEYFFIVDRLKELIKYKGYQVAPAELEGLLLKHEGVRDAGVVGIPDKDAGEIPLAFVVRQPDHNVTEKELQQYVAERLSNPKQLRGGVRFVNAIPKNPSGKILRKELKKMARSAKSKI